MSWSYRIRGRVVRAQTKNTAKNDVDITIMGSDAILGKTLLDKLINKYAENMDIAKIFVYSAMKIKANLPELYSVLNPETSSDSPSARSKGVRFVSASIVIIQITNKGNIKITNISKSLKF